MDIEKLIEEYTNIGYGYEDASSKICQDIVLLKIFNSKFKNNITIKGVL